MLTFTMYRDIFSRHDALPIAFEARRSLEGGERCGSFGRCVDRPLVHDSARARCCPRFVTSGLPGSSLCVHPGQHNGRQVLEGRDGGSPIGRSTVETQLVEGETGMISPGSLVTVRDETWLVTSVEDTPDGPLYAVRGVSDFVKDTTASFYAALDTITPQNPEDSTVVADTSPRYRRTRLWIESTLRKTPVPVDHAELTVSTQMLADDLPYQREAVERALEPERIRPRLLIADAVGLGKPLDIGMILAELTRPGRGRRIPIVPARPAREQMPHDLGTPFALPFVRPASAGVQQVKQQLPASRNPCAFFAKVIISMDALKQDRFVHDLRHHRWGVAVIDDSHNVTYQ